MVWAPGESKGWYKGLFYEQQRERRYYKQDWIQRGKNKKIKEKMAFVNPIKMSSWSQYDPSSTLLHYHFCSFNLNYRWVKKTSHLFILKRWNCLWWAIYYIYYTFLFIHCIETIRCVPTSYHPKYLHIEIKCTNTTFSIFCVNFL